MGSPVLVLLLSLVPAAGPDGGEVVGAIGAHRVGRGESLIEIARRYDLGFGEIAAANPRLDAFVPPPGTVATVPTAWILPAAAEAGTVVVNLSEMRLYYLRPGAGPLLSFPIGVAVEAGATPLGVLTVEQKLVSPTWYPTPAIRREDPELPAAVPPGPENPLGSHALRLSVPTLLIHGTNRPFGVGRRVSHGCIRLYPEDMPLLYRAVRVGTRVAIVREPVKVGVRDGRVLVEVHRDDAAAAAPGELAERLLRDRGVRERVDPGKLERALAARSGMPVDVSAE
ncbi:ErfK/YbiS/YcfS/YnhG family protein [Anaeromyxobacter dehalogenans 2CP-1]|uniref:ErfK/YbiS/YcfS/YnhG family protein n=1 Tax=Anaeromyxobacter dehalogenans (strain ATCC BAA-258 / DSM 21875 / 2CP-1) TaxID=455488 RepID=B8JG35_ANAD2|nr:L,D-transpeptidase family protein [Anaeromyxobacter dehalogenans]ACL66438.1 ErfK/YbiS/YcfS/YnhG family protein [Anaeromyxobacter dehalogenans 2CP-1]